MQTIDEVQQYEASVTNDRAQAFYVPIMDAKNYAEFVGPGEIDSWDHLQPGRGAVVRKWLQKVAAYRDPDG